MALSDSSILDVLACPKDKGPLWYFADRDLLYNPRLQLAYAVRDGIPVMLIDDATSYDDTAHTELMAAAESQGIGPNFPEAS